MLAASTSVYPYAVANTKSDMTRSRITGSKIKILGTSTYLYTMLIYDDKGRVIQAKSTNATGGTDVIIPFTDFLKPQGAAVLSSLPKAYLNIIFFDEQFKFVEAGSQLIPANTVGTAQHIVRIGQDAAIAQKNGYVYI